MSGVPEPPFPMRLQKFLARAGVASRRGSEALMTAGRVTVNGQVVTELGTKVDPKRDVVAVDGAQVNLTDEPVYLMLNKPAGYLSTMADPYGRPTVAELVPCKEHPGLFCVGRLDADTTGLLLFTTDGDLAQKILHPSYEHKKSYLACVEGTVTNQELEPLRRGITLEDGACAPAQARVLKRSNPLLRAAWQEALPYNQSVVELTIHEGRKHIVKRMLGAVGHPVVKLHRQSIGGLTLGGLKPATWRYLTPDEVSALRESS